MLLFFALWFCFGDEGDDDGGAVGGGCGNGDGEENIPQRSIYHNSRSSAAWRQLVVVAVEVVVVGKQK